MEKLFPGVFFSLERLFQGCFFSLEKPDRSNLENGDSARHDRVKVGASVRVKSAPENLHSEQSGDEDGEHEEDEEGRDAGDGVHQRLHQVAHAVPIPACHCVLGGNQLKMIFYHHFLFFILRNDLMVRQKDIN